MAFQGKQEESIYCLIPPVIEPPPKPPLYRSRYPGTVPANKKGTATMGPLKVQPPEPHKYLKAYTREDNKPPEPRKFSYRDACETKPAVPKREEKPVMGLVTSKNFITCNAVENILAVPKKTDVRQVSYMNKKGYGKVPAYLEKVKGEIQDEYNYIMQMQEAARGRRRGIRPHTNDFGARADRDAERAQNQLGPYQQGIPDPVLHPGHTGQEAAKGGV